MEDGKPVILTLLFWEEKVVDVWSCKSVKPKDHENRIDIEDEETTVAVPMNKTSLSSSEEMYSIEQRLRYKLPDEKSNKTFSKFIQNKNSLMKKFTDIESRKDLKRYIQLMGESIKIGSDNVNTPLEDILIKDKEEKESTNLQIEETTV